jgi:hypothetical protein
MDSDSSLASSIMHTTTKVATDYGLIIAIFLLIPLFCIKLAQSAFPVKHCSQTDFSNTDVDQCDVDRRTQMDSQYLSVLVMGGIVIVIAYCLFMHNITSRSVCLALAYGGMATLVYAIYANYNRLSNPAQMSIIGLVLVSFIFLPPLTKSVLLG